MKYKLAALDMDGTLLTSDKRVLPETTRDLCQASERGLIIVCSTGRCIPEITIYKKELPFLRYGVCMSGAVVYDFAEEKCLYRKAIGKETMREIIAVADHYGGMMQFLSEEKSIARKDQISHMEDFQAKELQPLFEQVAAGVSDMAAEAEKASGIPKVNIFFPTPELREIAHKELERFPLCHAYSGATSLELTPEGVTKGQGLAYLAEHLGIKLSETIAAGDSYNDREMLETAGLAIAVGNAVPEIKEICAMVADDNDHNGTGTAIRKLTVPAW